MLQVVDIYPGPFGKEEVAFIGRPGSNLYTIAQKPFTSEIKLKSFPEVFDGAEAIPVHMHGIGDIGQIRMGAKKVLQHCRAGPGQSDQKNRPIDFDASGYVP